MSEGGREDERRAFDGEDKMRIQEARDVFGVGRAERWGNRLLDGRQADDDDGLGVVERRCRIEAKVELLLVRQGDGGNVLILGGVKRVHDTDQVDEGADVGGVLSGATKFCGGGCVEEVGVRAGGKGGDEGLAVAVFE